MGIVDAKQLDLVMEYERFESWRDVPKVFETPFGTGVVHEREGRCEHETCYETHGTKLVFSIGDRYFLKSGTYDSQDGYRWIHPLREVKPVEKLVQDWETVPEKVWDEAGMSRFLRDWFKAQAGTRYSGYDWTNLYYQAEGGLDIPGFPYAIKAVEEYAPGEPESNGPVWLIFEINGEKYAAKGRNISHIGWDFDSVYVLEKVEKKTVTMEVWS